MKQPGLEALETAVRSAQDPLEIVNAFICVPDLGIPLMTSYWEHRICCLAEMVVRNRKACRECPSPGDCEECPFEPGPCHDPPRMAPDGPVYLPIAFKGGGIDPDNGQGLADHDMCLAFPCQRFIGRIPHGPKLVRNEGGFRVCPVCECGYGG